MQRPKGLKCCVAEVSTPSLGVGYEIEYVERKNLCFVYIDDKKEKACDDRAVLILHAQNIRRLMTRKKALTISSAQKSNAYHP